MVRLLTATRQLRPPLRAATYEALFGLIAATGIRLGEAIALDRDDDTTSPRGCLPSGRPSSATPDWSRCTPRSPRRWTAMPSAATGSARTRARTRSSFPASAPPCSTTACTTRSTSSPPTSGLRTATVRPRVHDLRHSFAVRTLIDWHRAGLDIDSRMSVLSTYLGHVNPAGTYWYLSASPELMALAAARLNDRYGTRR